MKKRIRFLLAVALILAIMLPAIPALPVLADGENTFDANAKNPTISTAADLKSFLETNSDFSGKTVKLAADITLNSDTTSSEWYRASDVVKVTPKVTYFSGTFDGQGHTVKGLVVEACVSWAQEAGMFAGARNATIKNYVLDGFYVCNTGVTGNDGAVSYGYCGTGAIVGHAKENVTIDNVTVKNGTVTCVENGYAAIGTIVGAYDGQKSGQTLAITNCTVEPTASVMAGANAKIAYIGGLIGYVHENYKSHPTTIDVTGSIIQPNGSTVNPMALNAIGNFKTGGDTNFLWTVKNSATGFSKGFEMAGGTDYTDDYNAAFIASGCYGATAAPVVRLVGTQTRTSDNAVRFVGMLKIPASLEDVSELGFEISVNETTKDAKDIKCTKVYTSIQENGKPKEAPEGYYYFTFILTDVPAGTTFTFRASATVGGVVCTTTTATYTYTLATE